MVSVLGVRLCVSVYVCACLCLYNKPQAKTLLSPLLSHFLGTAHLLQTTNTYHMNLEGMTTRTS